MSNPYNCRICDKPFDWDLELLSEKKHRLPVSCSSQTCSYTVCHECFVCRMANGEKFIECPSCQSGVGFYAVEPNISPFACLLLSEGDKKPAANPKSREDASVSSSNDPSAALPLVSQELETEESQPADVDMEREEEESRIAVTTPSKPRAASRELHDQSIPCPKFLKRKSAPAQPDTDTSESNDEGLAVVTPPRKKNRRCTHADEAPMESMTLQETESKSAAAAASHQKGHQKTIDGFFGRAPKQDTFVEMDSDDEPPKQLECSAEDHQKLKSHVHWVKDFQGYLMNETLNTLSNSNISRVLEQANLLHLGAGITAPQWRVSFMKGHKVDLTMDFDQMLQDAKDFEERHGKDKGRGWKLLHPIRKIRKFQKFVLEQEEE